MKYTATVYDDLAVDGVEFTGIADWVCDEGLLWLYATTSPPNKLRKDPPLAIVNLDHAVCVEFEKMTEAE